MLMGARGLFGALSTPMGDAEIDRFLEAADGAAHWVRGSFRPAAAVGGFKSPAVSAGCAGLLTRRRRRRL